ncbi:MAG: PIN domain-containing protein [Lachnospiraceae bacterium]|nr:PIN domain-containing protein [Lachnospiraceae bacterium]
MDILIDTNIILNLVFKRDRYEVSTEIFKQISKNGYAAYITASTVTDLFYIIRKSLHDIESTYNTMEYIFKLVNVLGVMPEDITDAFQCRWKDFEDCVQYTTAINNNIDYVITENVKDYKESGGNIVITPEEFIELMDK